VCKCTTGDWFSIGVDGDGIPATIVEEMHAVPALVSRRFAQQIGKRSGTERWNVVRGAEHSVWAWLCHTGVIDVIRRASAH
jgi:hypothetical protein